MYDFQTDYELDCSYTKWKLFENLLGQNIIALYLDRFLSKEPAKWQFWSGVRISVYKYSEMRLARNQLQSILSSGSIWQELDKICV